MRFLLNDVVFDLSGLAPGAPLTEAGLKALTFKGVTRMGQELFAEDPLFHRRDPDRARRLAVLLHAKGSALNAMHFLAPGFDCQPDEVSVSYARVSDRAMARLSDTQDEGRLDALRADSEVWRRLAA